MNTTISLKPVVSVNSLTLSPDPLTHLLTMKTLSKPSLQHRDRQLDLRRGLFVLTLLILIALVPRVVLAQATPYPPERMSSAPVRAFRNWLLKEVG